VWQRATDVRFVSESFRNISMRRKVALRVQYIAFMPKHTSLGELITALYDAAADVEPDDDEQNDDLVAVCTLDVLLRNRNRKLLAALVLPLGLMPN
jgi:hypothetical protein